jgi:hypothetical protein
MPAPVPLPLRRRILEYQQRGLSPAAIARRLNVAERTVRALCLRFRTHGAAAVGPCYRAPAPPAPSQAIQQALLLHAQHPTWGAPYLLLQLRAQHPNLADLPSARTLQRWFARNKQPPAPAGRKPTMPYTLARQPHEVWEMDAVEQLPIQSGQQVSWLRWVDELTGAVLGTEVFPPCHLRPGSLDRGAAGIAAAIWPLGFAPVPARRQRRTLGKLQRPADIVCFVGGRYGRTLALESTTMPAAEPQDRALAGDRQALGGAGHLPDAGRVAGASGRSGSNAARGIRDDCGSQSVGIVPGAPALETGLRAWPGSKGLEPGPRGRPPGRVPRRATGRAGWQRGALRSGTLRRPAICRPFGAGAIRPRSPLLGDIRPPR